MYLLSRGYTRDLLRKEQISYLPVGAFSKRGIYGHVDAPSILFPVTTISGRLAAWHTAGVGVKDYRTFYDLKHHYLPVFYATDEDFDILWATGQCVVTEGVFDRIAFKRAFPDMSVLARLTKGLSPPMTQLLERVCRRVWVAFDNDVPGNKAAVKADKKLSIDVVRLQIPFKDPSMFLEKRGLDHVRKHYQRQISAFDL